MTHADTLAHLRAAVATSPVVDTHEHLRPLEFVRNELSDGVVGLFRNSYLTRCLRTADGSPNGLGPTWEPLLAENTWETVREVMERVRFTSYFRWLMRSLVELYDLDGSELTPDHFEYLSAELPRRHADGTWLASVLDRAHIVGIIWDPFWKAGTTDAPDGRCAPSFRINSSVVAFHPEANDFEDSNLIRDWAAELDVDVSSLSDLEQLIDRVIAMNRGPGRAPSRPPSPMTGRSRSSPSLASRRRASSAARLARSPLPNERRSATTSSATTSTGPSSWASSSRCTRGWRGWQARTRSFWSPCCRTSRRSSSTSSMADIRGSTTWRRWPITTPTCG